MEVLRLFVLGQGLQADASRPLLTLLLAEPPTWDLAEALRFVAELEPLAAPPEGQTFAQGERPLTAELRFDPHRVELALLPQPMLLEELDRCVLASHWHETEKQRMLSHRLQLLLYYVGTDTDPVEQYLALYKVAAYFQGSELLGVANAPAWTAHPAALLSRLTQPEMLTVCRSSPPLIFWTGFLQAQLPEGLWHFTRGYAMLGLRELALLASPEENPTSEQDPLRKSQELFEEVFHYLYFGRADVQAGDLLEIDHQHYEFTRDEVWEQTVPSPRGFWVLARRSAAEAHQLMALRDLEQRTNG